MRRDEAPGFPPIEAGGAKEKGRDGGAPEKKASVTAHDGHCCSAFAPVAQWIEHRSRSPKVASSNLAGGAFFFKWIPERVNTPEPAMSTRIRDTHCTGEGSLSISLIRAFVKEPVVNTLKQEKKIQILNALIEGCSIRSIERMTGIHRDTSMRLGVEVGSKCAQELDQKLTNLHVEEAEIDEIWGYVGKKQKRVTASDNRREVGDQYIFVAIDAHTKLIASFVVGKHNDENILHLIRDLQFRVNNRMQITTDGFRPYVDAVEHAFGRNVDFAQLVKTYGGDEKARERYSPSDFVSAFPTTIMGDPKPGRISTSYIEHQNLTMRMQMRRFTRLTNVFSKKLVNLKAAVALHFAHYNFMRIHKSLRVTPAMEAGLTGHV